MENLYFLRIYKGGSIPPESLFIKMFVPHTIIKKLKFCYYRDLRAHFLKNCEFAEKCTPKNGDLPGVLSQFWLHQSLNGTLKNNKGKIVFWGTRTTFQFSRKISTEGFYWTDLELDFGFKRIEDGKSRHLTSRFQLVKNPWTLFFWEK